MKIATLDLDIKVYSAKSQMLFLGMMKIGEKVISKFIELNRDDFYDRNANIKNATSRRFQKIAYQIIPPLDTKT